MITPLVLVGALLPFFFSAFILSNTWASSIRVYLLSSIILFSVLILSHYIEQYKPAVHVNLPAGYEGRVLLFTSENKAIEDLSVDDNGIGFLPTGSDYHLNFKLGNQKMPEILKTGTYNQISFYNADSTVIRWVTVNCWEVGPEVDYEADHYIPRDYNPCLEPHEFRALLKDHQLDSTRLKWLIFNYNTDSYVNP